MRLLASGLSWALPRSLSGHGGLTAVHASLWYSGRSLWVSLRSSGLALGQLTGRRSIHMWWSGSRLRFGCYAGTSSAYWSHASWLRRKRHKSALMLVWSGLSDSLRVALSYSGLTRA